MPVIHSFVRTYCGNVVWLINCHNSRTHLPRCKTSDAFDEEQGILSLKLIFRIDIRVSFVLRRTRRSFTALNSCTDLVQAPEVDDSKDNNEM